MPPKAALFYIKSYLNGHVLDIAGASSDAGASVIMYQAKPYLEAANQLWYVDPMTSTIRSALNDYCLDGGDDRLTMEPYDEDALFQQWSFSGHFILNLYDPQKVMDVVGCNEDEGAEVCVWDRNNQKNQRWVCEYVPRVYFYIESELNGKVLDVSGANTDTGAEIIMYDKKDDPSEAENQLWYAGRDGLLRSKLNGFVIDSSDGSIVLQPLDVRCHHQGFCFSHGFVSNLHEKGKVLDIEGCNEDNNAKICEWDTHGNPNQKWRMQYVWE